MACKAGYVCGGHHSLCVSYFLFILSLLQPPSFPNSRSFSTADLRMLRTVVSSFFDMLLLSVRTIHGFHNSQAGSEERNMLLT